jgi:hypothetical protein
MRAIARARSSGRFLRPAGIDGRPAQRRRARVRRGKRAVPFRSGLATLSS